MRNIPLNHYTKLALLALGEFAGEVIELAFDPEKQQTKDYIRVKVKFDVSKPLRRTKKVTLPSGEDVIIRYDYERIQKRYHCQRLTHEQPQCHVLRLRKAGLKENSSAISSSKQMEETLIKENDPLFGVLKEDQVGVNPLTGRPRIAEEVLENMRQYIMTANGPEKIARQERVKSSLKDLENDPWGQKICLRLEQPPIITTMIDKGKGVVFDFQTNQNQTQRSASSTTPKLMAGAIRAGNAMSILPLEDYTQSGMEALNESNSSWLPNVGSTGFSTGIYDTGSSGTKQRKTKPKRRPGSFTRKPRKKVSDEAQEESGKLKEIMRETGSKRKANQSVESLKTPAGLKKPMVVPNEGPSNI
ncbi:hypothetical protein N665_0806s0003 [Sinapis alba]|nr:hypothetical protein N665_0806s0003 [Sinapis alba]